LAVARTPAPFPQPGDVEFSHDRIAARVDELGAEISRDYHGMPLVLVALLRGATIFLADLSRALRVPHRLEFMAVSAYRGAASGSPGRLRLLKDLDRPVRGSHVLVVEDVIDTGLTLHALLRSLRFRGPESLAICTLLDRPQRRLIDLDVRYVGFPAPDEFVVGYGFDYRQRYRGLPDIRRLQR
jgi:hypoxanthine phosphoribosyltransferase